MAREGNGLNIVNKAISRIFCLISCVTAVNCKSSKSLISCNLLRVSSLVFKPVFTSRCNSVSGVG